MSSIQNSQPPYINRSEQTRTKRSAAIFLIIAVFACACAVLYFFDPVQSDLYPQCAFRKMTGWSCPACGCLRATHQFLHGNIGTAFRLNALYITALPFFLWYAFRELTGRPVRKLAIAGWCFLGAFVLFGILRNLPPFLAWSAQ